jgi:hypothetical protein
MAGNAFAQQGMPYLSPNTNMNIGMDTKMTYNLGNMAGRPFQIKQYDNIKGSPYFTDSFSRCLFTVGDGKTYTGIKMKMNFLTNDLHFLGKDSMELVVEKGVIRKVAFIQQDKDSLKFTVFSSGYPSIDQHYPNSYYEEICSGRAMMLKMTHTELRTRQSLTSSPLDKEFLNSHTYYVFCNKKMERWTRGKSFALFMLSEKKDLVADFIEKEKIKCNSTADMERVINYYNQLPPG